LVAVIYHKLYSAVRGYFSRALIGVYSNVILPGGLAAGEEEDDVFFESLAVAVHRGKVPSFADNKFHKDVLEICGSNEIMQFVVKFVELELRIFGIVLHSG
jgi:hypothetical protein